MKAKMLTSVSTMQGAFKVRKEYDLPVDLFFQFIDCGWAVSTDENYDQSKDTQAPQIPTPASTPIKSTKMSKRKGMAIESMGG